MRASIITIVLLFSFVYSKCPFGLIESAACLGMFPIHSITSSMIFQITWIVIFVLKPTLYLLEEEISMIGEQMLKYGTTREDWT